MGFFSKERPMTLVVYYAISAILLGLWISSNSAQGYRSLESHGALSELPDDTRAARDDASLTNSVELPPEITESTDVQLALLQASLPKLYHSPEIFTLSYEEMWNQMQVWIYPSQEGSARYEHKYYDDSQGDVMEELTSTADLFFRLLTRSEFVTENPKQAQLFLMPVSMDALWVDLGPSGVAEQFKRYIQKLRMDFPFWDLSLGADHLYLSCHAFDRNSKHRNILELGKNTIQAACAPLRHNQNFYPHKDLVFPEYRPVTQEEIHAAFAGAERTTVAYFAASTLDVGVDVGFDMEMDPSPHRSSVYAKLARSKFCVSLPPHDALNVVDALRFGCVPVLVSKSVFRDLPFQGFLNWRQFALVLGVEDLPNLKTILTNVSDEKYREMQYLGYQASKHLEWNNPPVAYDAFHMTLLELWVRRHSIKYARRTTA